MRCGGVLFLEIILDGKRVSVPEWMTRCDVCAQLRCGVDPVCSWPALRQILALLDQRDL
jgi:hypothetical protein